MMKNNSKNSRRDAERQRAQRGFKAGGNPPGPQSNNQTPVEPEVMPTTYAYEEPTCADAAERVKFHLSRARVSADVAMRHIIEAGWELAKQKQVLGYGQWNAWCEQNVGISRFTADRYIAMFAKTVGVQRAAQSIGLEPKLLKKELDAATEGLEDKTVRQAMIGLGIVKRPEGWGGERAGAGRKYQGLKAEMRPPAENARIAWSRVIEPAQQRSLLSMAGLLEIADAEAAIEVLEPLLRALKARVKEA